MIASLPMYWRAENAAAWQKMWTDVQAAGRQHGLDLPDLTTPEQIPVPWTDHWLREDLILSQTCSMPLRTTLRGHVTYVGTFDFGLSGPEEAGPPEGFYHSVFMRKSNMAPLDGAPERQTLAINGYDSQSGYVAGHEPLVGGPEDTAFAAKPDEIIVTGSHAASLKAVVSGQVDGCYMDAVTHRLCAAYDPWAQEARVVGQTRPTPGLPLITAKGVDPAPLRAVLRDVFDAHPVWLGDPALGGLRGFVVHDVDSYLSLPLPEGLAGAPVEAKPLA